MTKEKNNEKYFPCCDKLKGLVEKMRPMDYMILGLVVFILIIFTFIFIGKKVYSPTPVENEGKVSYEIFFQNVKVSGEKERQNPFEVGADTFVTIRNQPHGKLKITDVKYNRKMVMIPTGNSSEPYVLVDDIENPFAYDFLITVEDNGRLTADGVVSGGNKVKIGLPIILEGPTYRFNGIITNVKILTLKNNENE